MSDPYTRSAQKLEDILAQLPDASEHTDSWQEVEVTARGLADSLRVTDSADDPQTALGRRRLPQTLTSLLKAALDGASTPDDARAHAVTEILRVAANLCRDHDENRGYLLEAGFPQAIVSILEGYLEDAPSVAGNPLLLSIDHLQVIKTAIGVLLNASVGYEPVKFRLISLEAALTLVRLSAAIYPPGSWTATPADSADVATVYESWSLRSGLSSWAWRAISELKDDSRQIFSPDVLPTLIPPLLAYIPPHRTPVPGSIFAEPSSTRTALVHADADILEESSSTIESLALDVEDVRLSLARGLQFPAEHNGVPCLASMLDFVDKGNYSSLWYDASYGLSEGEIKRKERTLNMCKAAVIKAIVEVAGEEKNEDVLWDDSEPDKPGGAFVCRMIDWVRAYASSESSASTVDTGRDDLAICGSLALGNLVRRETHATLLLAPPHNLASLLSSPPLLSLATDVKVKHGVIGLLKRIAQSSAHSPTNRSLLGEAGIVQRLSESGVWDERSDVMAEVVQIAAIGVVKHMCNGSLENALLLVLPSSGAPTTGLNQILGLIRRSDNIAIKSEGTRVLVNVIKSLWSSDPSTTGADKQQLRQQAIAAVLIPACAEALASLIGRSGKYPLLVNEGVVALTILSTNAEGVSLVAAAITGPLPVEVGAPTESETLSTGSEMEAQSPAVSPTRGGHTRTAFTMLISILKNGKPPGADKAANNARPVVFPVEVRANVCVLLGQIGKKSGDAVDKVKEGAKGTLEEIVSGEGEQAGKDAMLVTTAKKVLEAWA
ncbi:hypothetical protein PLICRDRAFT_54405 [Plicaturopsis crispa FD-325 SS-3]|nr:hypothetical protein PLICRDRAFT_54405 [Plicaturopsis crispa FD-325 SS-3]